MWFPPHFKNKDIETQKPQSRCTSTGEQPAKHPVSHSEPAFHLDRQCRSSRSTATRITGWLCPLPDRTSLCSSTLQVIMSPIILPLTKSRDLKPVPPSGGEMCGKTHKQVQMEDVSKAEDSGCLGSSLLAHPRAVQEEWLPAGRVAGGRPSNFDWEAWLQKSHGFEISLT